jgi:energy-coupling factor transporter ATP-binding protein EcfA2
VSAACVLDQSRSPAIESLQRFRLFTMAHPRLSEAKDELLEAIEGAAPGSLVLVLGPTGVGKTTLIKKVRMCLADRLAPQLESDIGRLPFVTVEAIAPDNGNFNWRDHFRRMLIQMQEPLIDHKVRSAYLQVERDTDGQFVTSPRVGTGAQMQYAVEQALRHRRPAAVFIDEAQHLARVSSGRKLADQLDVIKSIASRTETIHVLIGTYELLAFRNLSGQLSRRSVDLHFSRYRAESTEDIRIFQNVVLTFQQQLPPDHSMDLVAVWDFLYERSVGCVGILKDWLDRSLGAACRAARPLTRRTLEQAALSASQCEKIIAEAREGETRLMESHESSSRLRCLLGLSEAQPPAVPETALPPKPSADRKPGVRHPRRDRIGCTAVGIA